MESPLTSPRPGTFTCCPRLCAPKTIKSTMGQPTAAGTASASPVDPITPEREDGAVVDVATTGPGLKLQWVRRRASLDGCKLTFDSLDALDLEGARCTPRGDGGLRLRLRGGRRVLIRSPRKEDAKLLDAVAGPPTARRRLRSMDAWLLDNRRGLRAADGRGRRDDSTRMPQRPALLSRRSACCSPTTADGDGPERTTPARTSAPSASRRCGGGPSRSSPTRAAAARARTFCMPRAPRRSRATLTGARRAARRSRGRGPCRRWTTRTWPGSRRSATARTAACARRDACAALAAQFPFDRAAVEVRFALGRVGRRRPRRGEALRRPHGPEGRAARPRRPVPPPEQGVLCVRGVQTVSESRTAGFGSETPKGTITGNGGWSTEVQDRPGSGAVVAATGGRRRRPGLGREEASACRAAGRRRSRRRGVRFQPYDAMEFRDAGHVRGPAGRQSKPTALRRLPSIATFGGDGPLARPDVAPGRREVHVSQRSVVVVLLGDHDAA